MHRRSISRRALLGGAFATVAAVPLISLVRANAATVLPMTVTNNTGKFADGDINVYVVGTNLDTGQQGFVNESGFQAAAASLNGADGFADLSVPLTATISLPHMSGRVYFSLGEKLKFKVVTDGAGNAALQHPAGWVESDPSFGVLYDVVEFTFNDAGMFCNTTSVDMFSVPAEITLTGAKTQTVGTFKPGARAAIFAAMAKEPAFAPLIVDDLRVIAPGHGLEAGTFPADFYDSYVDQVYAKYSGTDLRISTNAGTFTGRVQGDSLVFDRGAAAMARPSTRDILFCDGKLAAPNDGITGPVAAVLGAAFNRSTLLDSADQPTADAGSFYQEAVTNHYSRVLHENVVDGRIYGFAFDDVVDFASFIQDAAPTRFTVNLTPFA
ncbi:beta-1,3-glucanase family protein [Actinoplanes sp. NPDC049548]|uniref:beta-1,3-glucanase family protein n=1 Tax=Actinoplanes sp. NPDC049548 TaxID=3155152 RepID=UPI00341CE099